MRAQGTPIAGDRGEL